jgi:hypothetical protein
MFEKYSTAQSKFLECKKNNMALVRKNYFVLDTNTINNRTTRERFVKYGMKIVVNIPTLRLIL